MISFGVSHQLAMLVVTERAVLQSLAYMYELAPSSAEHLAA